MTKLTVHYANTIRLIFFCTGKGLMQTYWVEPVSASRKKKTSKSSTAFSGDERLQSSSQNLNSSESRNERLADWIEQVMERLIKNIVARRNAMKSKIRNIGVITSGEYFTLASSDRGTVLDEVREIVELPEFDPETLHNQEDPDSVTLGANVKKQLHSYVMSIASMYNHNPFHNFEHAAHVTMSVTKLLSRIVAPDEIIEKDYVSKHTRQKEEKHLASTLHDHTYGITSDPLTQFACVFSSLIHDADHPGKFNIKFMI